MTLRRKIVLSLLVIPIGMLFSAIIWPMEWGPGTDMEIVFLVVGLPICLLNG